MIERSHRPMSRMRNLIAHWLLWGVELLVVGSAVLVLIVMVISVTPALIETVDGEASKWTFAALFVLCSAAIAVALAVWFIRGIRLPLEVRRVQRGALAIAIVLYFVGVGPILDRMGVLEDSDLFMSSLLATLVVAWPIYRGLFLGLRKLTRVVDNRSIEERLRPARQFLGLLAVIGFSASIEYQRNVADEPDVVWFLGSLIGAYVLYRIASALVAWRIGRKIEANWRGRSAGGVVGGDG